MAVGNWKMHNAAIEKVSDNTIDFKNDTLEVRLFTSASNVDDETVDDATTLTNEVTGNGYAAEVAAGDITRSVGVTTFGLTNVVYNASGGNIVARFAGLVDTTTVPDTVVAHLLLDDTPADITIIDGNPGTVSSPTGITTLARV